MTGVDWEEIWQWLWNGDLERCTEALICSAQEQALRTNYIKFYIDKTSESLAERKEKRLHDDDETLLRCLKKPPSLG